MQCIERVPVERCHYLLTLSLKEYKQIVEQRKIKVNIDDIKTNYDLMRNFCQSMIKANGEIARLYKFSGNNKCWSQTENYQGKGRLFNIGNGVQSLMREVRAFLLNDITTDIDIQNCHPMIAKYICEKHEIPCDKLTYYIEHRDEVLKQFPSREEGKHAFLVATNSNTLSKKYKNIKPFVEYDTQLKSIQQALCIKKCYKDIVKEVDSHKDYNREGSGFNLILCYYENMILQTMISELNKLNIELAVLMFDGCEVYGNFYEDHKLLTTLENAVNAKFEGLNLKLSYKQHESPINMPDNFVPSIENMMVKYEDVAAKFEKNHFKITQSAAFVIKDKETILLKTRADIRTAYEHMYFNIVKNGEIKREIFIDAWLKSISDKNVFEKLDCYPQGTKDKTVFNTWVPFYAAQIEEYTPSKKGLKAFLNHIKIMCNHNEEHMDYFIKWLAHMFQYPEVKPGIVPILITEKEGAGKNRLTTIIKRLIGGEKFLQTSNPKKDVFLQFNSHLINKFFIEFNEIEYKKIDGNMAEFKNLITEETLCTEIKGGSHLVCKSYHRCMGTTNKQTPIKVSKESRRFMLINSSDELVNNTEYFTTLSNYIDDDNAIRTFYDYLMEIDVPKKFNKVPKPVSEYETLVCELYENPIKQWLRDFTLEHMDMTDDIQMNSTACLDSFQSWTIKNNVKYEVSAIQFGQKLLLLNIPGVSNKHTKKGNEKRFDFKLLAEHFKLNEDSESSPSDFENDFVLDTKPSSQSDEINELKKLVAKLQKENASLKTDMKQMEKTYVPVNDKVKPEEDEEDEEDEEEDEEEDDNEDDDEEEEEEEVIVKSKAKIISSQTMAKKIAFINDDSAYDTKEIFSKSKFLHKRK